jgi:hypothetical protein
MHLLKCFTNDILVCTTWSVVLMIYLYAPLEVLYYWYTTLQMVHTSISSIEHFKWCIRVYHWYNTSRVTYDYIIKNTLQAVYMIHSYAPLEALYSWYTRIHRLKCCINDILVYTTWSVVFIISSYTTLNTSSSVYEYIINTTLQSSIRGYNKYNTSSGVYQYIINTTLQAVYTSISWIQRIYSYATLEVLYWWYACMHRLKCCINDILVYTSWSVVLMIY